ncbi:MAG: phage holin family protein [Propionibacteriaceae bacterium]|nr:phage holin family protein [Propionibacteriaceae bacterium]
MIKRIVINALALAAATFVLPGITLKDGWTTNGVLTLIGVAIVFGVVNAVVKPLFKVLTGCLIMLTFGLFLLVVNAAMMLLTSYLCDQLTLGWHVADWVTAIEGGLIVAVVSFLAAKLLKDNR